MPELPEVETFRRYMIGAGVEGARIVSVELRWPNAVRHPSIPEEFAAGLAGRRVEAVERRAKFLLFHLDNGVLMAHMRMTGSLHLAPSGEPERSFVRTVFRLDGGRDLRFADPRKLGQLWLTDDPAPFLLGLGPEPLLPDLSPNPAFTPEWLARNFQGRRAPVKAVLLDQAVVPGVGNIWADEALFAACIHPGKPAGALSSDEIMAIHDAIPRVLAQGVQRLSAIVPDLAAGRIPWESSEGDTAALTVPRKENSLCPRCGKAIARLPLGGRSAFFCPRCQPL
jgi:formamidopyrimidine-DNA glycosylase